MGRLSTIDYEKILHSKRFDMNFGGSWGDNSVIPAESRQQYLVSSLMEEAIYSSQMEGAATTRKVAKDMLRKKMSPRDKSQQMIVNNYQTKTYETKNKTGANGRRGKLPRPVCTYHYTILFMGICT